MSITRVLALLLLPLPQLLNGQGSATPADTAYARAALSHALQAFSQIREHTGQTHFEDRFVAQLIQWRMPDEAWSFALRRDSISALSDPAGTTFGMVARLLAIVYEKKDTAGIGSRIDRLPVAQRDAVLQWLVGYPLCNSPQQAQRMLDQIQDRMRRARALANMSESCLRSDSVAARARLREALDIVSTDTVRRNSYEARNWLFSLRRMGGAVSIDQLIDAVQRESGDRRYAQWMVATILMQQGDRAAAQPLLDTLLIQHSRTNPRPYGILASIHEMRGDTAGARVLRDSAPAQAFPDPQQRSVHDQANSNSKLWEAISQSNVARTRVALSATLQFGDSAGVLISSAGHARSRIVYPVPGRPQSALPAAQLAFAEFLYNELWRISGSLPALTRDSVRVSVINLLASYDEQRAAAAARSQFSVTRMRERALAEVVSMMVNTDADAAAVLAGPLQDPKARNLAFQALTDRAVRGGRLVAATRFADRTASGEARVRAQYAVARALLGADSAAQARTRLVALLSHLDPIWRCEGYCFVRVIAPGTYTALPPELSGMPRYLIGEVILLGLRAGAATEISSWATARPTAEARAAAGLVIAEAMAQHKLGQRPNYPMH